MSLTTRRPTGEAGWPNLLIEGKEGAWKTSSCLRFSADPRVGTTYVIEVGERRADEYAALGDFLVVEHDGTLQAIVDAIREVMAQAPLDGRPNVLIIDSGTGLWDLVKREAERIARSSEAAVKQLERDPNAEITVGHQAWNKAKDRYWWAWLNELRSWPGIALITGRADEVSKFDGGRPVANQTEYRVELEAGTRFILDGQVRMRGADDVPLVVTAKSLNFSVPAGGQPLDEPEPLAQLVFGLFGAGTEVALNVGQAKAAVMARLRALGILGDEAVRVAGEAWKSKAGNRSRFDGAAMAELLEAVDQVAAGIEAGEAPDGDDGERQAMAEEPAPASVTSPAPDEEAAA